MRDSSPLFSARLGSARLGSARLDSARKKHRFVYCCVIVGACSEITVLAWRKYATIYIMCFRTLSFMGTWVLYVCIVGANVWCVIFCVESIYEGRYIILTDLDKEEFRIFVYKKGLIQIAVHTKYL
jgi:hypothetical protein